MNAPKPTTKTFRNILRWIVFLPVGGVLIALAQAISITVAETYSWQQSAVWILIFGGAIAGAGMIPIAIAPDRKIGATILITLFVLFEASALVSTFPVTQWYPFIVRLYVDLVVSVGAIAGAIYKSRDSNDLL